MTDFPYSPSSGDWSKVLKRVQDDRPPDRLDEKFLQAVGLPKVRWSYVISSLKLLGFTDADGVPTQRWLDYRDRGRAQAVLAEAIREAFAALYADNAEAHLLSNEDLTSAFAAKAPVARGTGLTITRSFRNLCRLAGLSGPPASKAKPPQREPKPKPKQAKGKHLAGPAQPAPSPASTAVVGTQSSISGGNTPITINIQLTLPATKEAEVYDQLFAALKKHLLSS